MRIIILSVCGMLQILPTTLQAQAIKDSSVGDLPPCLGEKLFVPNDEELPVGGKFNEVLNYNLKSVQNCFDRVYSKLSEIQDFIDLYKPMVALVGTRRIPDTGRGDHKVSDNKDEVYKVRVAFDDSQIFNEKPVIFLGITGLEIGQDKNSCVGDIKCNIDLSVQAKNIGRYGFDISVFGSDFMTIADIEVSWIAISGNVTGESPKSDPFVD